MDIPVRTRDELQAVCHYLSDFPCRWWLGGGWAIDAWLGEQSRDHEDIEICIARHDQERVFAYCATWKFVTAVDGRWAALREGERLQAPQFMLRLEQTPRTHDVENAMPPTFEFLLNEVRDDVWTFSRLPQLQMPIADVFVRSPWGMDVTKPELLLLHKAVHQPRPKDTLDLNRVLPDLSAQQRHWLAALIRAMHGEHPWLSSLEVREHSN